jgi:hypothetical protein
MSRFNFDATIAALRETQGECERNMIVLLNKHLEKLTILDCHPCRARMVAAALYRFASEKHVSRNPCYTLRLAMMALLSPSETGH